MQYFNWIPIIIAVLQAVRKNLMNEANIKHNTRGTGGWSENSRLLHFWNCDYSPQGRFYE